MYVYIQAHISAHNAHKHKHKYNERKQTNNHTQAHTHTTTQQRQARANVIPLICTHSSRVIAFSRPPFIRCILLCRRRCQCYAYGLCSLCAVRCAAYVWFVLLLACCCSYFCCSVCCFLIVFCYSVCCIVPCSLFLFLCDVVRSAVDENPDELDDDEMGTSTRTSTSTRTHTGQRTATATATATTTTTTTDPLIDAYHNMSTRQTVPAQGQGQEQGQATTDRTIRTRRFATMSDADLDADSEATNEGQCAHTVFVYT